MITVTKPIKRQINAGRSHVAVFDRVVGILSCHIKLKLKIKVLKAIFLQKVDRRIFGAANYFIISLFHFNGQQVWFTPISHSVLQMVNLPKSLQGNCDAFVL